MMQKTWQWLSIEFDGRQKRGSRWEFDTCERGVTSGLEDLFRSVVHSKFQFCRGWRQTSKHSKVKGSWKLTIQPRKPPTGHFVTVVEDTSWAQRWSRFFWTKPKPDHKSREMSLCSIIHSYLKRHTFGQPRTCFPRSSDGTTCTRTLVILEHAI